MSTLKERLDLEVMHRNRAEELCEEKPDPLMVARRHNDEISALACALFAYGKASSIVQFLNSLDFTLIDAEESIILKETQGYYYRFQNAADCAQFLITLRRLRLEGGAEEAFMPGYHKGSVFEGLKVLIDRLYELNAYHSQGYQFLIGKPLTTITRASALKRWLMYLRWMVRDDALDMGIWRRVDKADLLMPLDTHTFNVSRRLGLLDRSICDLRASIELTERLKAYDPHDPVKYDFALYRLGQEKEA